MGRWEDEQMRRLDRIRRSECGMRKVESRGHRAKRIRRWEFGSGIFEVGSGNGEGGRWKGESRGHRAKRIRKCECGRGKAEGIGHGAEG
jgi:hypothetical protein